MTKIEKTTDHDLFTPFTSNREIDEKHVAQLVKSITDRNLLHINPILVDAKMRIIDGQHRLEAAKRLNVPIYYIVSTDVDKLDISKLNSNQKNWNTMDYINFYTVEQRVEFLKFSKFLNAYPHIKVSSALVIVSGNFTRNSEDVKRGILNVDNINFGHQVAQALEVLNKKYQHLWIYDSRFPVALARAMKDKKFSLEQLINKIDLNPRAFVRTTTTKESVKMIEEIYNYRMRENAISLS